MPEVAYELERFAPRHAAAPRVKVAKKRRTKVRNSPLMRMLSVLFMAVCVVVLVCGVLYTQITLTELESQIEDQTTELTEEEAMYAYLSFELESMTNLNTVEMRAKELGLEKMKSSQITYIRVEESDAIEVKQSGPAEFWQGVQEWFWGVVDKLS